MFYELGLSQTGLMDLGCLNSLKEREKQQENNILLARMYYHILFFERRVCIIIFYVWSLLYYDILLF